MAELRREGRVPVSTLGIKLTLTSLVLISLVPLLPKGDSSPIYDFFESSGFDYKMESSQSSWSWVGNLVLSHLSIPILGTAFLLLITVFPLALLQSKFFISFSQLRRAFEVRDTRSVVFGRILFLLIGLLMLLWFMSTLVFSIWSFLVKGGDDNVLWNSLLLTARTSIITCAVILLFLGFLSMVINQFWFRLVNRESDGRFRKTRE